MKRGPKDRHRFSHEGKLAWLTIGAVAPAVITAMLILWLGDYSAKVQWTLTIVIIAFAAGFISAARDHVVHPLQTMSNLLAAWRAGGRCAWRSVARDQHAWRNIACAAPRRVRSDCTFANDHGRDRSFGFHVRSRPSIASG